MLKFREPNIEKTKDFANRTLFYLDKNDLYCYF